MIYGMQKKMKKSRRLFPYRIGIGYEGVALKYYLLHAENAEHARELAIRTYLHPDFGYDHVEVKRLTKAEAAKYEV